MQALVTGSARRIGRAIALELHEAGYRIAVHYRTSRREAEETAALLGGAPLIQGDQAREPERIVAEAVEALGGLDLLVNSAAQFEKVASEELDRQRFEAMLAANLTGPFLLMRAALPHLRRSQGSIVNLVDVCGTSQVWKGYAHYAASKAGLATLTRLLALEWAPEVRVNAVAPGTALLDDRDQADRLAKRIPLGRIGTPEDVARAVLFLARAPYVTGQVLAVDGGRSLQP
ncbi:MAG TPA: SDR family oxidoreductase [Myxococcales bacterium]|jgi:pteridine reductase|nr:SDR family oxidoreductase [Myxococcales bacterium]